MHDMNEDDPGDEITGSEMISAELRGDERQLLQEMLRAAREAGMDARDCGVMRTVYPGRRGRAAFREVFCVEAPGQGVTAVGPHARGGTASGRARGHVRQWQRQRRGPR